MIVVDTSALVAVAFAEPEPEREEFVGIIEESGKALISSVSVVEANCYLRSARPWRRGDAG